MATREQLLAWARSQLGTTEHGGPHGNDGNIVCYWDDISHHNLQGQPWCDAFVQAGEAAVGVPVIVDSQYCDYVLAAYRKAGRVVGLGQAKPGDQVFFHFPGEHSGANHTGILESVDAKNKTVTCIEGNTSAGAGGSQRDGGGVHERTRSWTLVIGVGEPTFTPSTPMTVPTRNGHPLIGAFSHGPEVALWQTLLNDHASMHLTVDGSFGSATVTATQQFQKMAGIKADGIVGDATWAKMLALTK